MVLSAQNSWIFCVSNQEWKQHQEMGEDGALNKYMTWRMEICAWSQRKELTTPRGSKWGTAKYSDRESWNIPAMGSRSHKKRLGQVRGLKMKQEIFSPTRAWCRWGRNTDREKSSSFALPGSQSSLVGFSHTPFCTPEFLLLLQSSTVVLEVSSQAHRQNLAQWQRLLANRETPGHCFTSVCEHQESTCQNPFFLNSPILLGKIIFEFICSDNSGCVSAGIFTGMQDRAWFCFTKLSVQSWKGNQNSMGLSWKRLREAQMQKHTA